MISLTSERQTRYHRWPAGLKLLGLCLATLGLFFLQSVWAAALATAAVMLAYLAAGSGFAHEGLRLLRPVFWVAVIILTYHFVTRDLADGLVVILRLIAAVALANLVTMTTRLDDMLSVVEAALTRLGLPQRYRRRLSVAVALVIRFIPVLVQKGGALVEAWRARSARRPGWRLLLPFALLAIDDAEQVGEALKARGGGL